MPRPAVAQLVCRLIAFRAGKSCLFSSQIVNDQIGTLSIRQARLWPLVDGQEGCEQAAGASGVGGITDWWGGGGGMRSGQPWRWQNLGDGENVGEEPPVHWATAGRI